MIAALVWLCWFWLACAAAVLALVVWTELLSWWRGEPVPRMRDPLDQLQEVDALDRLWLLPTAPDGPAYREGSNEAA
jgi:hypothetical protein